MLIFKRFTPENSEQIKDWFKSDPTGIRFLSSYAKPEDFIHSIDFKKRFLWIVEENNIKIGLFDFEIESDKKGYFVIYLAQDFRGKGLGFTLLQNALKLPEVNKVKIIEGGVEKDNVISIKTLERSGFRYVSTDKDDMLVYQLDLDIKDKFA